MQVQRLAGKASVQASVRIIQLQPMVPVELMYDLLVIREQISPKVQKSQLRTNLSPKRGVFGPLSPHMTQDHREFLGSTLGSSSDS